MTRPGLPRLPTRPAAVIGAVALALAACSGETAAPTDAQEPTSPAVTEAPASPDAATATVNVAEHPEFGTYLVGPDGRALYLFTQDSADTSVCTGDCATAWPPLTADGSGAVSAGEGVPGTLATITRDDGTMQVAYDGIPLYYFQADAAAGDTNGQGVNGVWFLVAPDATAEGGTITGGIGQDEAPPASPAAASPSPEADGGEQVRIANFAYAPATVSLTAGATVSWTNDDSAPHTVTADDGSFDSGTIAPGGTFEHTFTTPTSVTYVCTLHPAMTGSIIVATADGY
jgi:predicted lipoprotein with Yx(FWY)xxD motif/plastocyanin